MDRSLKNVFGRLGGVEPGEMQRGECKDAPEQEWILESFLDDRTLPDSTICWCGTQRVAGDRGKVMEQLKVRDVQVATGCLQGGW